MLGFDAVGRLALGQLPTTATNTVLTADAGSYTITGVVSTFKVSEAATAGAYALTGVAETFKISLAPVSGAYVITGVSTTENIKEPVAAGAYVITGNAVSVNISMVATPGSYVITPTNTPLVRTGGDYDQVYGGIGHYLEEIERQRQLAKITRKTPAPIVQQSIPFPQAAAAPQGAQPQPVIDLQAIQQQRMADAQAQAEQVRILRRRQAIEILLLAS